MTDQDFEKILQMGIALTVEKDRNRLLDSIVEGGMSLTGCDASTLYLYEDGVLKFRIMRTISQNVSRGRHGEPIEDIPPVPFSEENVCAYTAIHRTIVNIPDVYHSEQFDFSGPKRYDSMTGYRTQSMLVIPIENNEGDLLGVLQMMNAQNQNGRVIAFNQKQEVIIRSLASLAAIELTNIGYMQEIKMQQHSFVEAMATAIDMRTPYNGNHTRKVAQYTVMLAEKMNEKKEQGLTEEYFDKDRMEKLELASLLHDIGKMVVPLEIMNRSTRLGHRIETVRARYKLLTSYYELDYLKGRITKDDYEQEAGYLKDALAFAERVNEAGFLADADYERVQSLAKKQYVHEEEGVIPYLTQEEEEGLSVRKGTLTAGERKQMEDHVVMTSDILGKVRFNRKYADVPKWAGEHHEFLDGSGYPKHLTGDRIALETKMLTIADIYDALTARDRPYKSAISQEQSFRILYAMAEEGKIDQQLVQWLEESLTDKKGAEQS